VTGRGSVGIGVGITSFKASTVAVTDVGDGCITSVGVEEGPVLATGVRVDPGEVMGRSVFVEAAPGFFALGL